MANYLYNPACITPKMTSANTPSPVIITSSSDYSSDWAAWRAFTQSATDSSWSASGTFPQWVKVNLGEGKAATILSYDVIARHDGGVGYTATAWILQGSNNDNDWTDLDTQTGHTWASSIEMKSFTLSAASPYFRYFRFYATASQSGGAPCLGELQLVGLTSGPRHLPLRGRSRFLSSQSH